MLSAKMWNEIAKKYGFEMAKRVDSLPKVHESAFRGMPLQILLRNGKLLPRS